MPLLAVLLWIAAGGFMFSYLIRREGDGTPTLILLAIVVYFGVPLALGGLFS